MDIGDFITPFVDEAFLFDKWAEQLLQVGITIWNWVISKIIGLLGIDLETFAGGAGLDFVKTIQPAFLSLACPLFICFFLYNLYYESFEEKRDNDFWSIIKMFVPLVIGEAVLMNSITIVVQIFRTGFWLVKEVTGYSLDSLLIDSEKILAMMEENSLRGEPDIVGGIVRLLFSFFTCIVLIVCAGLLVYIVYFRNLKLYAMLPFSSLAFCMFTGPQEFKRVSFMYIKYTLVLALQSVAMLIMIILCNVICNAGINDILNAFSLLFSISPFMSIVCHYLVIIFNCCLTVGAAKGSEVVIEKWLLH